MFGVISDKIWQILACPSCGISLSRVDNGAVCKYCGEKYCFSREGQLDLRLRGKKRCSIQFELGMNSSSIRDFDYKVLEMNDSPEIDFRRIKIPRHLNRTLLSYFPRASSKDSLMLDVGCGKTLHKDVCEYAGFEYVGLDYDSPHATILGDAHALPFKDNSFEFVLSIAVLEHIRHPIAMMKELFRTLRNDGRVIGTVAFLEPFHSNSFYHHSPFGTLNSLETAGFNVENISPVAGWSVLNAQASVLFPRLPRLISMSLILPLHLLHRIWWKTGSMITNSVKVDEKQRLFSTAGAFSFIATKRGEC